MAPVIPPFSSNHLEAICEVLGDTSNGLTGSEIGRLLVQCRISDTDPGITKRHRLFNAFAARQNQDQNGNGVCAFIAKAMEPVRYRNNRALFDERRDKLNITLAFVGMSFREDGKFERTDAVSTLDEAEARVGRLRKKLLDRNVHADVLKFCKKELLQDNYFHAVLEATKSVADKIRNQSGLTSDGHALIDAAFGIGSGTPRLAFNTLQTETERNEHLGLMNLMKGLLSTFRNTTAHAPKIYWSIEEQDALDMLSLCSLLQRRLDKVIRTGY